MKCNLTILFEDPFWIGLYERIDENKYEVCKITFGAEPKDYEVYEFLLKNWDKLKFSPSIEIETAQDRKINPKRMQREISSHLQNKGIGTKAQQALKLQHEQNKVERITKSREQREAEQDRQYALRQKKKNIGGDKYMIEEWLYCPVCGNKTRIKMRYDTELIKFPLFCPKCKKENLVNVKQFNISVITEPDAQTQSR